MTRRNRHRSRGFRLWLQARILNRELSDEPRCPDCRATGRIAADHPCGKRPRAGFVYGHGPAPTAPPQPKAKAGRL